MFRSASSKLAIVLQVGVAAVLLAYVLPLLFDAAATLETVSELLP